ncbi:M17 family metallopeptidase [Mycoplasmopsis agassizii]|uniref:M17 family metallopeptidase n=1 Tax=Mycoplasmopsis agassizii TaxID=33922 RepID=UPI0035272304
MILQRHSKERDENVLLIAAFEDDHLPAKVVKREGVITEFLAANNAYLYVGKRGEFDFFKLEKTFSRLYSSLNRKYQIDVASFVTNEVSLIDVYQEAVLTYAYAKGKLWSKRKVDEKALANENKYEPTLLIKTEDNLDDVYAEAVRLSHARHHTRNFQETPPNVANSEYLAEQYKTWAQNAGYNLEVKVLDKAEIKAQDMNLLLAVNQGSMYEPRVVVVEYKGNPESEEKQVIVGKGITFDSGGYNLKPSGYIKNMKYDMSGSAIALFSVIAASRLKLNKNFAAVLPLTDNRLANDAMLPDSVVVSKSGISVEITNTDAEGRLILADAITYAIDELKATEIVDVATLTGAIKVALGDTYTGFFASEKALSKTFAKAAKEIREMVWELPLDDVFFKDTKKSTVADLVNSDATYMGGSISAALFVHEFAKKVKHIHIDIAGTGKKGNDFTGVMVKTIYNYLKIS